MILRKTFIFHGWFFAQSLGYVIRQKNTFLHENFFLKVFFFCEPKNNFAATEKLMNIPGFPGGISSTCTGLVFKRNFLLRLPGRVPGWFLPGFLDDFCQGSWMVPAMKSRVVLYSLSSWQEVQEFTVAI